VRTTICGTFDSTHFDGDITVDIDGYTVEVASDSDLLVRITGPGAEAIELVGVDIYGGAGLSTRVGANTFYGDHGATALHLSPGTYELVPFALNSASITNDVPYRVWVETDSPATRCEELTTGGYSEGTGENDVIAFPSSGGPMLTAATTDSPEDIGVTLNATASTRIAGTATDIAMQDKYEDRDTFELRTQSSTNEATLMLNWTGAADLDFFLFEPNNLDPIVRAVGTTAGNEVAMTSLKTTHTYWLVVAAKTGSAGLPASYSATLCGGHFY
jgi:hypothetical protein